MRRFLWTANDLAGALLDDANEVGGVGEVIDSAGVEPDVALFECPTQQGRAVVPVSAIPLIAVI